MGGFGRVMQKQLRAPIEQMRFTRIELGGALIVSDRFQGVSEFLIDIPQEMMQIRSIVGYEQLCCFVSGDAVVAGLGVCQRQIIGVLVIRRVVGSGTLQKGNRLAGPAIRDKQLAQLMVDTEIIRLALGQFPGAFPDAVGHGVVVDLLTEGDDVADPVPGHERQGGLPRRVDVIGVLRAPHPVAGLPPGHPGQIHRAEHLPGGQAAREIVDRGPAHEGVVHVEERAGRRVGDGRRGVLADGREHACVSRAPE